MKKITVITGHYGSGKTNFSVNIALRYAKSNKKITVVDLDIVNPYFRTADFNDIFEANGISLAAPAYANSNLDLPALSFDPGHIAMTDDYLIIDVGGDDEGAKALGRYKNVFAGKLRDTDMFYIVNKRRLLTGTPEEALSLLREIEEASGLKATGLVNNTNLADETTSAVIEDSNSYMKELSEKSKLPIVYTAVPFGIKANAPNQFPVEIYVKKIWEK